MTSRAERVEVWSHAANLVTRSFTPEYRTLARQMQVTGTGFGHGRRSLAPTATLRTPRRERPADSVGCAIWQTSRWSREH
jgi:hypothetical protein